MDGVTSAGWIPTPQRIAAMVEEWDRAIVDVGKAASDAGGQQAGSAEDRLVVGTEEPPD